MSTIRQLVSRNIKFSKRVRPLVPALKKCPQKRGVVQKTIIETPKKPNSAKRKAAKVKLSNGRIIKCYLPGIGHRLSKHSVIMVRGGRAQDLIGVRYKAIFGKFDFFAPSGRVSRLSKFGLSSKQNRLSKNKIRFQYENKLLRYIRHVGKYKPNKKERLQKVDNHNEEYHYDESEYEEKKIQKNSSFFYDSILEKKANSVNVSLYPNSFFFSDCSDSFDINYVLYHNYWLCYNDSVSVIEYSDNLSSLTLDNNIIISAKRKKRFSLLSDFSSYISKKNISFRRSYSTNAKKSSDKYYYLINGYNIRDCVIKNKYLFFFLSIWLFIIFNFLLFLYFPDIFFTVLANSLHYYAYFSGYDEFQYTDLFFSYYDKLAYINHVLIDNVIKPLSSNFENEYCVFLFILFPELLRIYILLDFFISFLGARARIDNIKDLF